MFANIGRNRPDFGNPGPLLLTGIGRSAPNVAKFGPAFDSFLADFEEIWPGAGHIMGATDCHARCRLWLAAHAPQRHTTAVQTESRDLPEGGRTARENSASPSPTCGHAVGIVAFVVIGAGSELIG